MSQQIMHIELQVWREEDVEGSWRCRIIMPDALQSARFDSPHALAAFVALHLELMLAPHTIDAQVES